MPTIAIGSSLTAAAGSCDAARQAAVRDELRAQVLDDGQRVRVVEHQRRRQPHPGRAVQPVAQLDRGQRVEAQLVERLGAADRVRRSRGRARRRRAHARAPAAPPAARVRPAAPAAAPARRSHRPWRRPGAATAGPDPAAAAARRRSPCAARRRPARPAPRARDPPAQAASNSADTVLGGQRTETGARQPVEVGLVELVAHPAGPQAPGERQPRAGPRHAALGQCVERRVRGGVVRLAGAAEHAGSRGEQREQRQVGVGGQVVQVHRGIHFGPQHGVESLGRQ